MAQAVKCSRNPKTAHSKSTNSTFNYVDGELEDGLRTLLRDLLDVDASLGRGDDDGTLEGGEGGGVIRGGSKVSRAGLVG